MQILLIHDEQYKNSTFKKQADSRKSYQITM